MIEFIIGLLRIPQKLPKEEESGPVATWLLLEEASACWGLGLRHRRARQGSRPSSVRTAGGHGSSSGAPQRPGPGGQMFSQERDSLLPRQHRGGRGAPLSHRAHPHSSSSSSGTGSSGKEVLMRYQKRNWRLWVF